MTLASLIGAIAAFCTTISFLPQAIKVVKTRDTSGLSLAMYIIFSGGVALWLVYGLMIGDAPIIFANAVTLSLALVILYMKVATKDKD